MRKDKKTRFSIIGILIFVLVFTIIMFNFSSSALNTKDICVEGDSGNVLCLLSDSIGQVFSVGSNKMNQEVQPGETIRISESIEYTQSDLPFTSARIFIFKDCPKLGASSCSQIDAYNVKDVLNNLIPKKDFFGSTIERGYVYNAITIVAPSESGQYWVTDSLVGSKGQIDTSTGFSFSVAGNDADENTECPKDEIGDWKVIKTYADGSGRVESKRSIYYGSEPECKITSKLNTKTICSDGYLAKGTDSPVSDSQVVCVKIVIPDEDNTSNNQGDATNTDSNTNNQGDTNNTNSNNNGSVIDTEPQGLSFTQEQIYLMIGIAVVVIMIGLILFLGGSK